MWIIHEVNIGAITESCLKTITDIVQTLARYEMRSASNRSFELNPFCLLKVAVVKTIILNFEKSLNGYSRHKFIERLKIFYKYLTGGSIQGLLFLLKAFES